MQSLQIFVVQAVYFVAAILFILGLKKMSSPVTARRGIVWAGIGMLVATITTFMHPDLGANYLLIIVAIAIGGGGAWYSAKKVSGNDIPHMIALYNGLGGGAAAAIAAVALIGSHMDTMTHLILAVLGACIGTIALSGSVIAFAKLSTIKKKDRDAPDNLLQKIHRFWQKTHRFNGQQKANSAVFIAMLLTGIAIISIGEGYSPILLSLFFILAFLFGIMMTVPIGGADMPVVISLYNAFTGLAVGFEGFVLNNPAMMIAGIVVGSAGTLLTQLMAKAMNRPITNVLFSNFGESSTSDDDNSDIEGTLKEIEASDVAVMMAFAEKVIIIPGYGMAAARAQHKIWELTQLLQKHDVDVKFAIHPVAGRMPGHMNVLLAEADVPYRIIYDLDEINEEFATADVALVIGANDVVNPVARNDPKSPIYGMPILNADQAKNTIVMKRGRGTGFSGVENHLFYADNTRMLYGDGLEMAGELVSEIKNI